MGVLRPILLYVPLAIFLKNEQIHVIKLAKKAANLITICSG